MADIPLHPELQVTGQGSFAIAWDGVIQGMAQPDPEIRFQLMSGWLDPTGVSQIWGGEGITEFTALPPYSPPAATAPVAPGINQQGMIELATNLTPGAAESLTGFSVFDQAYGMMAASQSQVPQAASLMQVMFYRLGSGARIALKMDPTLAVELYTDPITEPLSWDFINQQIIAFDTEALPVRILRVFPNNCMVANYGAGMVNWNRNGAAALVII